ncbi:unnamed protein product [Leuciscus chuanchicus]
MTVQVEKGLTTPGGRLTEAEQVEVETWMEPGKPTSQGDAEDPEGHGDVDGSGNRGAGGDPEGRGGAGATEDQVEQDMQAVLAIDRPALCENMLSERLGEQPGLI